MKCSIVKIGKGVKAVSPKAKFKVGDPAGDFELHVGEDGSVTVFGVNDQGQVDISGVATLQVTSADPTIVGVSLPTGMTFKESALALGGTTVTIMATWNDSSVGPFTVLDPVSVIQAPPGPVTGLIVVHGTPTVR